ncbi:MAG: carbohydrate ABC transporter permease [Spirochaetales bacterium]
MRRYIRGSATESQVSGAGVPSKGGILKRTFDKRSGGFRANAEGYAFLAPALLLIGVFGIWPVIYTIYISFHRWRINRGPSVGFDNYLTIFGSYPLIVALAAAVVMMIVGIVLIHHRRDRSYVRVLTVPRRVRLLHWGGRVLFWGALTAFVFLLPRLWNEGDDRFWQSLRVTVFYSLGTVPIQIVLGMLVAVMFDQRVRGKQAFRVIYLLPYIAPNVAAASIFQTLFSLRPESFANQLFAMTGNEPLRWVREVRGVFELAFGWGSGSAETVFAEYWQGWIQGPGLSLVTVMILSVWIYTGYYALIYANGLSNIPRQLYEAAEVDGAGRWTKLRDITIPLLSPTTLFLTMLGVIGTFKSFNTIYVMRLPAAAEAVDTLSIYLFFTFYRRQRYGYAGAMALVLFLIILGLTVYQRKVMERRVHYGD